jgi:hypothetical protein
MMDIYKQYHQELPPFTEYWELIFKKKQMKVIARKDGSKVVHFARLLKYVFAPIRETDIKTTDMVYELAPIAVNAIITELLDEKKATFKYLSISGTEYSFDHSTNERK